MDGIDCIKDIESSMDKLQSFLAALDSKTIEEIPYSSVFQTRIPSYLAISSAIRFRNFRSALNNDSLHLSSDFEIDIWSQFYESLLLQDKKLKRNDFFIIAHPDNKEIIKNSDIHTYSSEFLIVNFDNIYYIFYFQNNNWKLYTQKNIFSTLDESLDDFCERSDIILASLKEKSSVYSFSSEYKNFLDWYRFIPLNHNYMFQKNKSVSFIQYWDALYIYIFDSNQWILRKLKKFGISRYIKKYFHDDSDIRIYNAVRQVVYRNASYSDLYGFMLRNNDQQLSLALEEHWNDIVDLMPQITSIALDGWFNSLKYREIICHSSRNEYLDCLPEQEGILTPIIRNIQYI